MNLLNQRTNLPLGWTTILFVGAVYSLAGIPMALEMRQDREEGEARQEALRARLATGAPAPPVAPAAPLPRIETVAATSPRPVASRAPTGPGLELIAGLALGIAAVGGLGAGFMLAGHREEPRDGE